MSERPFMQLYVSDFVGDTLSLSTEQIGAYLLLLIALWNGDGTLPADDAKLARITRLSLKKWRSAAAELMPFFDVDQGRITHSRLTKELQKVERQRALRASAGARGGAATALKNNKPRAAFAAAKLVAEPQHLPEPYKKEGNSVLVGGDGAETISLDRFADMDLFEACERVQGAKVKSYLQSFPFPVSIVAQGKASLAKPEAAA